MKHVILYAICTTLTFSCAPLNDGSAPAETAPVAPPTLPPHVDGAPAGCTDTTSTQVCGLGVCTVVAPKCRNGRPFTCMPAGNMAVPEICNGLDDNCDGILDNAPGEVAPGGVCNSRPKICPPVASLDISAGRVVVTASSDADAHCGMNLASGDGTQRYGRVLVHVRETMAIALSTNAADTTLAPSDQRGADVIVPGGACGEGHVGAAIVPPGEYVITAGRDTPRGAFTLVFVASPVPANTPPPIGPTETFVTMNTAVGRETFDCERSPGSDVRVLLCPSALTLTATRLGSASFRFSVEAADDVRRTCYFGDSMPSAVPLPQGLLAVVRAWGYGGESGPIGLRLAP